MTIAKKRDNTLPVVKLILTTFGILLVMLVIQISELHAANSPALRLFPTTVVENIKQTGITAKSMESNLQEVINDLEQKMLLFNASKCQDTQGDEGCDQISKQMGEAYRQMLEIMEQEMPSMEQSVEITRDSLKKRIRSELGMKLTPRQLQKMLRQNQARESRTTSKKRKGRLSEKFDQYYKMVAMGSRDSGGGSLAAVASKMYLDTEEVLTLIALTRDEISRSRLMIDLDLSYGSLTPEMISMVSGVKSILFGEDNQIEGALPDAPLANAAGNFKSPLDL